MCCPFFWNLFIIHSYYNYTIRIDRIKKGEITFWTIEQNFCFLWLTLLQLGKRIILRCLSNQRHHRNIRRFKRLHLLWHNCGSTPNKKKRKTRRLKSSRLRSIKRFLQNTNCSEENVMRNYLLENKLDVGRPMREPPFIFLRYLTSRCWWYMLAKSCRFICSFFCLKE